MDNKADKCNGISRVDTRQPIRRVTGHTLKDTGACDADWEFAICIKENDIHELRKVFPNKINREKLTRFIDACIFVPFAHATIKKLYGNKSQVPNSTSKQWTVQRLFWSYNSGNGYTKLHSRCLLIIINYGLMQNDACVYSTFYFCSYNIFFITYELKSDHHSNIPALYRGWTIPNIQITEVHNAIATWIPTTMFMICLKEENVFQN